MTSRAKAAAAEADAQKIEDDDVEAVKQEDETPAQHGKRKQKGAAAGGKAKRQTRHTKQMVVHEGGKSDEAGGTIVATWSSPVALQVLGSDLLQDSSYEDISDFDEYLCSLEGILTQPLPEDGSVPPEIDLDEITEGRSKLLSLLALDFPDILASDIHAELAVLAAKLQKDTSLKRDQLELLKLIEEIPLASKDYQEVKEVIEKADKFFADLEANIKRAISLREDYNEAKEKETQLQVEVDQNTAAIKDIDEEIARLQAKRAELSDDVEIKTKAKFEQVSNQKVVVDSLPRFVREVQLVTSKKREWELRKSYSVKREAEIIAQFSPLKGFKL